MARIRIGSTTDKGVYKNIVLDIGREVKIGIGYVNNPRTEQSYLTTMEMLEGAIIRGDEINPELWKRLHRLPKRIQKKLEKKRLIVRQESGPTMVEIMTEFIADKLKTGDPRTVRNYKTTLEKGLLTFLDQDKEIRLVGPEQLLDFIDKSSAEYANSTVANHIKRAKALFQFAMDRDYITENPFTKKPVREKCALFTIKLSVDREQTQTDHMTPAEIDRLLKCKKSERSEIENLEWNALVYLLRFGAGRISSYLILRWQDIDFETEQIRLRMKRTGKRAVFAKGEKRIEVVPLFDEMVRPLLALRDAQPEGTEYVLNKIGNLELKPEFERTNAKGERIQQGRWETNLSTTFKKILKRNGFQIWSQPFHAFRSYRGAELDRQGASEIELNAWVGNSSAVRKRHYGKFHMTGAARFKNSGSRKLIPDEAS